MLENLRIFFSNLNSKGVPIPVVRDPKTGVGSVTLTMVVVSFGVCIALLAGRVTQVLGQVNYDDALWLLGLSLSTYLGRQYQKNGAAMSIGTEIVKTTDSAKSSQAEAQSNADPNL